MRGIPRFACQIYMGNFKNAIPFDKNGTELKPREMSHYLGEYTENKKHGNGMQSTPEYIY